MPNAKAQVARKDEENRNPRERHTPKERKGVRSDNINREFR